MFEEFLTKTYYGNTVQQWLISLALIFAVAIVGKMLYWIVSTVIKALTKKTKSKLDDIIIDMVEEPLVFAMILVGVWYAIEMLTLSKWSKAFVDHAFQFLIVINVTWLISRLFEALYEEYMVPFAKDSESDFDDQLFPILRQGLKGIVWTLGIIIGLNNAGYDVGAVLAGLGIGGIALAMAAKDTVANVFGGITIFTDKLFKIKDRIVVKDIEGFVEEIGLRSTKVRNLEGRLITVPNSLFSSNAVENVSSEPTRKVSMTIGISCDTPPLKIKQAMDIINKILEKNQDLTKTKYVSFNSFGDFTFNISVIYYIKKGENIGKTKTDINLEILKQFNKNKIEIPYPTSVVLSKKA